MKRLSLNAVLAGAVLLAACSSPSLHTEAGKGQNLPFANTSTTNPQAAEATGNAVAIHDANGTAILRKVAFRTGVSSVSVERLARRAGCAGGAGAGLVTDQGPVEIYRMQCDNGTTFLARCEFRQCRPMR